MARHNFSRGGLLATLAIGTSAVGMCVAVASAAVAADGSAAHAVAQRFAEEHARSEREAAAAARRKMTTDRRAADERDMLARAKTEAAERARLDAERADTARLEAEQRRREQEMTAHIRAETAAAEARRRQAEVAAERERQQAATAAERARLAEAEAEAVGRRMEAERTAELDRISEQLRRRAQATDDRSAARSATVRSAIARPGKTLSDDRRNGEPADAGAGLASNRSAADEPPQSSYGVLEHRNSAELSSWRRPVPPVSDERVTLLMVMQPGNRGIRRFDKTADPVVCFEQNCFVSNGASEPARALTRFQAFGTFNTIGGRAGACRNTLACAYPGIDLKAEGRHVQPVDLRIMRHDRREVRTLAPDPTCGVVRGRLVCGQAVQAETWRMWVVPQGVADAAGPSLIEAALASGLGRDQLAQR